MKPANLLFILSDQHNRDALGCYGSPLAQTPNLDQLAARGTRFDSAYTNCPICVPARASLATGQYVHQIRYWDNAFPYEGRIQGWGHRLIDAGHDVVSVGKLHYRSDEDADGFSEHQIPLNVVDGIGDVMGCIRDDPPIRNGARDGILGAGAGSSTYLDYDERIAEHASRWLDQHRPGSSAGDSEKPWVLFVSFVCPHPPYVAPPDLFDLYPPDSIPLPPQSQRDDRPGHPALEEFRRVMQWTEPFSDDEVRRMIAAYYGCCTHLDRQIGRVLDSLEQNGLTDNTRIVYTSDHGESMGRRGLFGKFTHYEESSAVPLIVAGPDVPKGESTSDPVSLVDCHQTILECTGTELNGDDEQLPGSSLWPIARGESLNRAVLSEYHAVGSRNASFMIRRGRFKYIHYVDQPCQLFDLTDDPDELHDLSTSPDHESTVADCDAILRSILDPEAVDEQAKSDQQTLIEKHGGVEAVLQRGTFTNSPAPGETPAFHKGEQA